MIRPRKNPGASGIRTRDLPLSRRTPQPLGQRGGDIVRSNNDAGRMNACTHNVRSTSTTCLVVVGLYSSVSNSAVNKYRQGRHFSSAAISVWLIAGRIFDFAGFILPDSIHLVDWSLLLPCHMFSPSLPLSVCLFFYSFSVYFIVLDLFLCPCPSLRYTSMLLGR